MKIYLQFSTIGEITELKTKDKLFNKETFNNYSIIEYVDHDKYRFVICKNNINNLQKNITFLPFYQLDIHGDFLLFLIDNDNNIISLTESKFLKFTNKKLQNSSSLNNIEEYSSDDFSLSD